VSRSKGLIFEDDAPIHHAALISGSAGKNRPLSDLIGGISSLPNEAMGLAEAMGPFRDQGQSASCVGHGITRGADTRLRFIGAPGPYGSPRAVYTLSNELLRINKHDRLRDEGTYARTAMQVCADFGVPPEDAWPLWKEDGSGIYDVTQEVPPDVQQRASAWKLKEQFTVYESGQARIERCCDALAKGFPLPCAATVDGVFESHAGQDVIPAPEPGATDGHMLCLVGYRTNASGRKEFILSNSWLDWGFDLSPTIRGVAWVDEAWVIALREIYGFTLTHGRAS
jgi:hypothetical protein